MCMMWDIYLFVCRRPHSYIMLHMMTEEQKTNWRNFFSSSTMWSLELKLRSSDLKANTFCHWAISLTSTQRTQKHAWTENNHCQCLYLWYFRFRVYRLHITPHIHTRTHTIYIHKHVYTHECTHTSYIIDWIIRLWKQRHFNISSQQLGNQEIKCSD